MDDSQIIALLFKRDESALGILREKYGNLLLGVARKITGDDSDAEECLSDAMLNLWNAIPPARPENLRAYSCRTVRNLALKRLEYSLAKKRTVNSNVALEELEAVISDAGAEERLLDVDFSLLISDFLDGLGEESRAIFMKRYFFMDSVKEIAGDLKMSESKVKSALHRARNRLKKTVYEEAAKNYKE